MNRLIVANFMRVKASKLYWALCGSMGVFALMATLYADKLIDGAMTPFVVVVEIASAIFISLFFGTEYSDRTIHNKLIVGYDRRKLYFANLITSVVCAIGLAVSYMVPVLLIGFPCIGLPSAMCVKIMAVGLVTLIAFCCMFTMVSMVYTNKAGATVVNLMLVLVLSLAGSFICSTLYASEFIQVYGTDLSVQYVPNPRYLTGAKRALMQFLACITPPGQAIQYVQGVVSPLWTLPLYSLAVCVICSLVGTVVFHKKDIK